MDSIHYNSWRKYNCSIEHLNRENTVLSVTKSYQWLEQVRMIVFWLTPSFLGSCGGNTSSPWSYAFTVIIFPRVVSVTAIFQRSFIWNN
jgi:hypothetical protein